ncbi:unnamed protein product [Nippostrongylus brasiliensis]|uniref:DnaJ homolog subfamily C member 2 n=1 Tax=Nippostrongylus brasiliensis TaxID=27835 RepID=A0A0N4XFF2_NIPBR|nr:unnamed protein product [Nippostrongylus brasiliensis]
MLGVCRVVLLLLAVTQYVQASWNSEDLALYDLVEDLNKNFYEFFGIDQDAPLSDIKKAYRKLSLEWHPDRNSAPDASEKFRQVVSVYEVLKSTELREKYNHVLEFGLPDWRQPIYYYRKMRKFTWYEALLVLVGVSTIAHYFMMWAAYYEKYLVLSQNLRKSRKREKKGEVDGSMTQIREALEVYRPQFYGLLPFLIAKGSWSLFIVSFCINLFLIFYFKEEIPEPRRTAPTVRVPEYTYEVATDLKAVSTNNPELYAKYLSEADESQKKHSGGAWTSEELYQLVRLTTENLWIVLGTPNRWECMARVLNRSAQDITAMAAKLKQMKQEEYAKLAMGQQSVSSSTEWSQAEQKQFEAALQQYPKGCEERWEKIASAVPTKTKEQCQQRLKELVELVRRKKASTQNNN